MTSGVVVGILGSRLIAGVLADLWGWRSIYVALAALSIVLGVAALRLLPTDVRPPSRRYADLVGGIGRLLTEPVFLSRGAIAFFLFASFGTLWSGMALPLSEAPRELSETQIWLFGLAGLTGALGAVRAGHWADGGKANRVTGLALVALVASWVLIAQLTWSLTLLIVGIVVLDFAVQAVHVSNQHTLTTLHPDRVSTTIGGYMIFYSLGSAVGAATTTVSFSAWGMGRILDPGRGVRRRGSRRVGTRDFPSSGSPEWRAGLGTPLGLGHAAGMIGDISGPGWSRPCASPGATPGWRGPCPCRSPTS